MSVLYQIVEVPEGPYEGMKARRVIIYGPSQRHLGEWMEKREVERINYVCPFGHESAMTGKEEIAAAMTLTSSGSPIWICPICPDSRKAIVMFGP